MNSIDNGNVAVDAKPQPEMNEVDEKVNACREDERRGNQCGEQQPVLNEITEDVNASSDDVQEKVLVKKKKKKKKKKKVTTKTKSKKQKKVDGDEKNGEDIKVKKKKKKTKTKKTKTSPSRTTKDTIVEEPEEEEKVQFRDSSKTAITEASDYEEDSIDIMAELAPLKRQVSSRQLVLDLTNHSKDRVDGDDQVLNAIADYKSGVDEDIIHIDIHTNDHYSVRSSITSICSSIGGQFQKLRRRFTNESCTIAEEPPTVIQVTSNHGVLPPEEDESGYNVDDNPGNEKFHDSDVIADGFGFDDGSDELSIYTDDKDDDLADIDELEEEMIMLPWIGSSDPPGDDQEDSKEMLLSPRWKFSLPPLLRPKHL